MIDQYTALIASLLIITASLYILVKNPNRRLEMSAWVFVGFVNAFFYWLVIFSNIGMHTYSPTRTNITLGVILGHLVGYHIAGEKYGRY